MAVLILSTIVLFTPVIGGGQAAIQTSSVANTNSAYSLQLTHQVVTRMANGTLCAAFSTNLLGTSNYEVYVTTSNDNGATWGSPTKISNATGMDNLYCYQGTYGCSIATDANNNLYVAWNGVVDGSSYFQVWCARYNGTAWETPQMVSQGAAQGVQSFYTSIAVDANNTAHLVWQSFINGYANQRIFYAYYNNNGSWSAPIAISTQSSNAAFYQMYPDIAVDGNNNLNVVWYGGSGSIYDQSQIWYAKFNGSWQTPICLSNRFDLSGYDMNEPCIAVDSYSNLHVVWSGKCDSNPNFEQIWYANYTGTWNTPIMISNTTSCSQSTQDYPTIAVDNQNRLHVAWNNEGVNAIFCTDYATGWSTPIQTENSGTSYPHFRWSFYPRPTSLDLGVDFVFLKGSIIMYQSGLGPSVDLSATISPTSGMALLEQPVQFTSTVVGGKSPYSYQWYMNGSLYSSTSTSTLTYTPHSIGAIQVFVKVTDAESKSAESGVSTVDVLENNQTLIGVFGNPKTSSSGGGSGTPYTATGSRYNLNVGANVTSISCLLSMQPWPSSSVYCYRYAIYADNNGAVGKFIAQTSLSTTSGTYTAWKPLDLSKSVYLNPGAYWLVMVSNASQYLSVNSELTSDSNKIVDSVIGGTNFPPALPSPIYSFGMVKCMYATWALNFAATLPNGKCTFNIDSNSTISELAFNSSKQQLSFIANGTSGTNGYTQVFIPKDVLPGVTGLNVTIDGQSIDYTATSFGSYWLLYITYHHSTHNVDVNLPYTEPSPSPSPTPLPTATPTPTPTPTPTTSPTATPTPIPQSTATPTSTPPSDRLSTNPTHDPSSTPNSTPNVPELPSIAASIIIPLSAIIIILLICKKRKEAPV